MELSQTKIRYSVHVDRERCYEVHGLGLPFERLYFEAREQLVHATDALALSRAECLRYRSEELGRPGRARSI